MFGRIPQQFIDDLVGRADIVELIGAYLPLKKAGREYTACCPFHAEKTPSFTVSPTKQFYHCFGCGAHGTVVGFLMQYDQLEFPEAVEALAARLGVSVPREQQPGPAVHRGSNLYEVLGRVAELFRAELQRHPAGRRAAAYLERRGIDPDTSSTFAIGYAPPGWDTLSARLGVPGGVLVEAGLAIEKDGGGHYDRFRDRLMFPIRDRRGRTVGFGGRVLDDSTPKYLNSSETSVFHKGRELYGLHEARQALRGISRLLVVEGYMDVVALAQHGVRYAVATLGTSITPQHLEQIFRTAPEVVFCFDGDRAGRQAAWRALEQSLAFMQEGRQARFMFLPEGEDPDTLVRRVGGQPFERSMAQAMPLSDYLIEGLSRQTDARSLDGRARLVELSRPLIQRLPAGVFREMMLDRLASISGVSSSRLAELLGVAGRRIGARHGRPEPQRKAPSAVRSAIAILLQHPTLGADVEPPPGLESLDLPGASLLARLLELARQRPHLSTGALLEHCRDWEEWPHLGRLASWRLATPEEGLAAELRGALQRLAQRQRDQRIDALRLKPRADLSADERAELRGLLSAGGQAPLPADAAVENGG